MKQSSIIVVGAGHAGVQAAASLREEGHKGLLILVSDEDGLPYHRPPLSKAFLKAAGDGSPLPLRSDRFYAENSIELMRGDAVVAINRDSRALVLRSGQRMPYDHLILAMGSRGRRFDVPGAGLRGIFKLRNAADARSIRLALRGASRLVVIGAGFIGLEIAATATEMGIEVDIVEVGDGPLGRRVSPGTAAFYGEAHRLHGARLHFNMAVAEFVGRAGALEQVRLSDGTVLDAGMAVVGIGVVPNDELAQSAGLACQNGVLVDESLSTSDPDISAIGDVAHVLSVDPAIPIYAPSVQNAIDQGRFVAKRLMGDVSRFRCVPCFWSDQRDLKLQIVGLSGNCSEWFHFDAAGSRISLGFSGGALAAIETVNRPKDHMLGRRLFEDGEIIRVDRMARLQGTAETVMAELMDQ